MLKSLNSTDNQIKAKKTVKLHEEPSGRRRFSVSKLLAKRDTETSSGLEDSDQEDLNKTQTQQLYESPAATGIKHSSSYGNKHHVRAFWKGSHSKSRSIAWSEGYKSACSNALSEHSNSTPSTLQILTVNILALRAPQALINRLGVHSARSHSFVPGSASFYCKFRCPGLKSKTEMSPNGYSLLEQLDEITPETKLKTSKREMIGPDGVVWNEQFDIQWNDAWEDQILHIVVGYSKSPLSRSKNVGICALNMSSLSMNSDKFGASLSGYYSLLIPRNFQSPDDSTTNWNSNCSFERQNSCTSTFPSEAAVVGCSEDISSCPDKSVPALRVRLKLWEASNVIGLNASSLLEPLNPLDAIAESRDRIHIPENATECLEILVECATSMECASGQYIFVRFMMNEQRKDSSKKVADATGFAIWNDVIKLYYCAPLHDSSIPVNVTGVVYAQTTSGASSPGSAQCMGLFSFDARDLELEKPDKRSFLLKHGFCGNLTLHLMRQPYEGKETHNSSMLWGAIQQKALDEANVKLRVHVLQGRDLKTRDSKSIETWKSDAEHHTYKDDLVNLSIFPNAYVSIKTEQQLTDDGVRVNRTRAGQKTVNPKWNETFVLDWHVVKEHMVVYVDLFDEIGVANVPDTLMGRAPITIPSDMSVESKLEPQWVAFDVGSVKIQIDMVNIQNAQDSKPSETVKKGIHTENAYIYQPVSPKTDCAFGTPESSNMHLSPNTIKQLSTANQGLSVGIVGLRGLTKNDIGFLGHKSVLCQLTCGSTVMETDAQDPGSGDYFVSWTNFVDLPNPKFSVREVNTGSDILSVLAAENPIVFKVFASGFRKKRVLLGSTRWNLEEIRSKDSGECWLPLTRDQQIHDGMMLLVGVRWTVSPDYVR